MVRLKRWIAGATSSGWGILCSVLTGRPPYLGTRDEVLAQAQQGHLDPAFARLEQTGADAELVALAKGCLAVEQDDRPQDAGEVAQSVAGYLARVEERARLAEVERARAEVRAAGERRARRLTLGLALAALLLVLAGGTVAWVVQQQYAATAARQREADEKARTAMDQVRKKSGWGERRMT